MSKEIWSKDGMALSRKDVINSRNSKICLLQNSNIVVNVYDDSEDEEFRREIRNINSIFQTRKRAELERDRREVDYTMKKMACESREDNDWRHNKRACSLGVIKYAPVNEGAFFEAIVWDAEEYYSGKGEVYFRVKKDAQKCLDHLIEKYGEERLKEIWGGK
jgi:hypothetical protein